MCLLTFIPANIAPDMEALRYGTWANNDGHGYAIVTGDRLIIRKGLDAEDILAAFEADRAEHMDGPALFHSRFTTHGRNTVDNCHPFYVGADRRTVLAHNGVLPKEAWPNKGDHRSDTRYAAETLIPAVGSLRHRWLQDSVAEWMGRGNKMVILTVNPKYGDNAFILNESSGIWDGGIWYSNDGYCSTYSKYLGKGKGIGTYPRWWDEEEDYAAAAVADASTAKDSVLADVEAGRRCPECFEEWLVCDCWVPARERAAHARVTGTGYPLS